VKLVLRPTTNRFVILLRVGDDVLGDPVGEIFLLRIAVILVKGRMAIEGLSDIIIEWSEAASGIPEGSSTTS
jgi:hypothetical protein